MSFSLRLKQPPCEELKRLVSERIDDCRSELASMSDNPEPAVHAMRKNFKRIRSLYRLVGSCDDSSVQGELFRVRDLGRMLSGQRDAAVLLQSLIKLQFVTNEDSIITRLQGLSERLEAKLDSRDRTQPIQIPIAKLAGELELAEAQVPFAIGAVRLESLISSYGQTYHTARKRLKLLKRSIREEDWHDWRKDVKNDWYQTQLLKNHRSDRPRKRLKQLRELSDLLGYDHDLSVLSDLLLETMSRPDECDREILDLVDLQRDEIQKRSRQLGTKLYREKTKRYLKKAFRKSRLTKS